MFDIKMINNVVIVRFSLRIMKQWEEKAYGDEIHREDWYKYRADLFTRTLYCSLCHQTMPAAKVYLVCAEGDEPYYERYLGNTSCVPIFSNPKEFNLKILSHLKTNGITENIAYSRIDSDDLISKHFLLKISNAICSSSYDNHWFVATNGYRMNDGYIQKIYYNCSPFLTFFSKGIGTGGIYSINHEHVVQHPHTLLTCSGLEWIQLIHASNIGNAFVPKQLEDEQFNEAITSNPKQVAGKLKPIDADWFASWAGFPLSLTYCRSKQER
ncbi:hypothetical protein [Solidesulfovibrio sp.]|uniref:hypothetical protein n=1 Tax=Solidesulfovibrio sp. TaxID=2910990 RepID=UPI002B1F0C2F|nr:hypothetical protein [Solidesulfovibrio sp.]MEA5088406.1 hypothetical protein [Solidesulfovibrio sp.]